MDLSLFHQKFGTENRCKDFLFRNRWPHGFQCSVCGYAHYSYIWTRELYECLECRTQTSLTSGTLFHRTRLPLQYWFLTMYLVANDAPCSARWLSLHLKLNYRTAQRLLQRVRTCMRRCNIADTRWTARLLEEVQQRIQTEADEEDDREHAECRASSVMELEVESTVPVESGEHSVPGHESGARQTAASAGIRTMNGSTKSITASACPVVDKAWQLIGEKAMSFIRRTYRKVQRRYLKSYVEEFYFRWAWRLDGHACFWQLAQASTGSFIPSRV